MKRKLIILLVICLVLGFFVGFDVVRSKRFHIDLVTINPEEVFADGKTETKITVKLTNSDGEPVEGHNLFAVPVGGGTLRANREQTDEDGFATFTYYPYKATSILEAKDIRLEVIDESNSVFIEINSKKNIIIPLKTPKDGGGAEVDLSHIFGS